MTKPTGVRLDRSMFPQLHVCMTYCMCVPWQLSLTTLRRKQFKCHTSFPGEVKKKILVYSRRSAGYSRRRGWVETIHIQYTYIHTTKHYAEYHKYFEYILHASRSLCLTEVPEKKLVRTVICEATATNKYILASHAIRNLARLIFFSLYSTPAQLSGIPMFAICLALHVHLL